MVGGASNIGFIHSLLIQGDNLRFMGRSLALVKEIALGQERFTGGQACFLEQKADFNDGQTQHKRKIGLAQKDRALRMLLERAHAWSAPDSSVRMTMHSTA